MNRYEIYMTMDDMLPSRDDHITINTLHNVIDLIAEQLEDRGHAALPNVPTNLFIYTWIQIREYHKCQLTHQAIIRAQNINLPFGVRETGE